MKKIITFTIILSLTSFLLNAQPCLPNGIVFTSQAQIDNFGQQYNCSEIQGNVTIMEAVPNDITNLNGLSQITKIDGYLSIKHNSHLKYLTGLDNLTEIGDFLSIYQDDYLKNINALSNVTSIGSYIIIDDNDLLLKITGLSGLDQINGYLKIKKNPYLSNLEGLDNVTTISGELQINNNSGLTDMFGLGSLTSIGSNLNISYNSNLNNLTGLEQLNTIGGYLNFYSNNNLSDITALSGMTAVDGDITVALCNNLASLSGLENIDPATINSSTPGYDDLNFHNNSSLSECEVLSICEVLNNGGTTNIHDNASGCNSEAEVTEACTPPECTNLTDPVNGETDVPVNTNLNWAESSNADGYNLCVGYTQNCDIFNGDVGNTTTWNPPEDFYCDTTVYALIQPYNNAPYNTYCSYENFHTETVQAEAGDNVEICYGSSTQLQASGGTIYSWYPTYGLDDPNISNPIASPEQTTTYTVTVSNDNGCSDTDDVTVTVNPLPVPNASATDETGNDFNDGTATTNPTGGTPGYTYAWNNGESTQTIYNLAPGDYTVTVSDTKSCSNQETVTVHEFICPTLSIVSTVENITCNGDCNGKILIDDVLNGVPPFTYNWSNGETTSSIDNLCPGDYYVTITDSTNCSVISDNFSITEPNALLITEIHFDVSCFAQQDGIIDITVSGGTPVYTYLWNNGATTEDLDGLSVGEYTVTVTDTNNCTSTMSITINEPPELTITVTSTDETASEANDGTAQTTAEGGTPPFSYLWSNGETTASITDLAPGEYSVTVTDANNCQQTGSCVINSYDCNDLTISYDFHNVSCFSQCDGDIIITAVTNATEPLTYNWSNGETTSSIDDLCPGDYYVTITDSTNCSVISNNISITEPNALLITEIHFDVSCFAQKDGSIDITVTGGTPDYTYQWNIGATTEDLTGLSAGEYTVTVTDTNSCTATMSITINEPPELTIAITSTDETASEANDGTAQTTAEGGTPPFSYLWSNGETTASITDLVPGEYSVTVTDANNCQQTGSCVINSYGCNNLTISYDFHNVSCFGQCDGDILITAVTNATEPLTYNWNNGNTTSHAQDLCAGSYSVTITDSTNCSTVSSFEITQPDLLYISSTGKQDITDDNPKGSIQIEVAGGVPPYVYRWSGDNGYSSTEEDIDNLDAGCYLVVVTDENKCSTHSDSICIEDHSTAVLDLENELNLRIYPNPANDILYFKYDKNKIADKNLLINIYNISGSDTGIKIDKNNGKININQLKEGIYMVLFKTDEGIVIKKIAVIK